MTGHNHQHWLHFTVAEQDCVLALESVERIIRIVEITPLPDKAPLLLGVINLQGQIIPVIDLGFGHAAEPNPDDRLIVVKTQGRLAAVRVDYVHDVIAPGNGEIFPAGQLNQNLHYTDGALKLKDSILLILNLDHFLAAADHPLKENTPQAGGLHL